MSLLKPSGKRTNHKKGIAASYLAKKREEAVVRQKAYAEKSVHEILEQINRDNYRAERQRRKLAARLASETAKKEVKGAANKKR